MWENFIMPVRRLKGVLGECVAFASCAAQASAAACEYMLNKIYRNSKIFKENYFQRFYFANRVRWFRICYCQQHVINICCCLRLKSQQISELSKKRAFNGSTKEIEDADYEYDIVTNM